MAKHFGRVKKISILYFSEYCVCLETWISQKVLSALSGLIYSNGDSELWKKTFLSNEKLVYSFSQMLLKTSVT